VFDLMSRRLFSNRDGHGAKYYRERARDRASVDLFPAAQEHNGDEQIPQRVVATIGEMITTRPSLKAMSESKAPSPSKTPTR